MLKPLLPVRSLLLAIFILMAGGGCLSTLTSIRLEASGSGALRIGIIATAYFAGLTIGSLRVPPIVYRVGHIRAFAAFVSLFSASTLAYAIYQDTVFWTALRFIDGLCVAGVFVCLESWLNERAEPQARGTVLAGYMIALYAGQAIGQFLLNAGGVRPSLPFMIASILISLAAIPVALTRIDAPTPSGHAPLGLRSLYTVSPLGIVGATVTGMMMGAFYGLGAVYVRRLGLNLSDTALFMSVVILGGVALQWPLGRLSDRFDRRRVIVGTLVGVTATSLAIALTGAPGLLLMGLGALFGGLTFALYPLCVAHTNDHLEPEQRIAASGGLILLYSIGSALGPMTAAVAMKLAGPPGLFVSIALGGGAALIFAFWRQWAASPVPEAMQQSYQILPRTTPMSAVLDPLAQDETWEGEKAS